MAAKSLRTSIHINWTLPAYLSLIPVACHTLVAVARLRSRHAFNRLRMNGLAWTFGCCIAANIIGFLYLLVLQPRTHLIRALGPWRELADVVERHEDELEAQVGYEPLILADGKYRLASILAFYRVSIEDQPTAPFTSNQWFVGDTGLGYAYWQNRDDWLGKTCLYLDDDGNVARDVRGRFDSFEVIEDPKLDALGYQLAICRGYRGPGKPRMQDR
ncbi:MAG TPA: hypothetical protein VMS30_06910, partial [Phycisphaerales bacterium]|nr:hypothetical protein [Phycisphaerales bacterium]